MVVLIAYLVEEAHLGGKKCNVNDVDKVSMNASKLLVIQF